MTKNFNIVPIGEICEKRLFEIDLILNRLFELYLMLKPLFDLTLKCFCLGSILMKKLGTVCLTFSLWQAPLIMA